MKNSIKVYTTDQKYFEVEKGTRIIDILDRLDYRSNLRPLGAVVNNLVVELTTPLKTNCHIQILNYQSKSGAGIYRRSASLILLEAITQLYPNANVVIGQSLQNGYFYDFIYKKPIDQEIIDTIFSKMLEIVQKDIPIKKQWLTIDEAKNLFIGKGLAEKFKLISYMKAQDIKVVNIDKFFDIYYGPTVPSTGYITTFKLNPYEDGFVLQFPDMKNPHVVPEPIKQPKLFSIYRETKKWNEIIGVSNIAQLNELCLTRTISKVIKLAEGLHEKKIAQIADTISKREGCNIVLISGPSSSGKTTFAKRLEIQLNINGLRTITISMDNYFVERDKTPRDEHGNYDFENPRALDIELINDHLEKIMNYQTIRIPFFSFKTGTRIEERTREITPKPGDIIIMEGIHALNNIMSERIPPERKFKIYISALTQLSIDDHNRIFTSDTRLIRRIVRDRLFRGYSACQTIKQWNSVRRGEEKYIFPHQEEADIMFNSALIYEHAVLKAYAEKFLLEISPEQAEYQEAQRLLNFLDMFVLVLPDEVPNNSILREFIGNSSFSYKS